MVTDKPQQRYYRKIIRIRAEDSPNVQLGLMELQAGKEPTNRIIVPGVLPWADYQKRRRLWDQIRQAIGLDAVFWEGSELLLFPPDWLNRAEQIADAIGPNPARTRKAKAIGIDPAEGGDKTSMCAVDELGVIDIQSRRTPNTAQITGEAIAFGRKYQVPPTMWFFDAGGGGVQHADRLRDQGLRVRTVAFGESVMPPPRKGSPISIRKKVEEREERYTFKNRRAEMYGMLRDLLDPSVTPDGFGIPARFTNLRQELAPIPLLYDNEGRMYLPPKRKKSRESKDRSLTEIIGHSPDEADALVLAVYGMKANPIRRRIGAF